jgi:hypothetical protein
VNRLAFATLLLIGATVGAQNQVAPDLWAGTWKLNLAQSTFHAPAPKQETIVIAPAGPDGLAFKYSVTGTSAKGTPINVTYDGRVDGKLYPHYVNGKATSQVSYSRHTIHEGTAQVNYDDGSTGAETLSLAADGRSFTVHLHVKGKQGEYDETHVFNKT